MDNVVYDGAHSITFISMNNETRNTWTDWGLVPSSRHTEPLNEIWSNQVNIGGVNGQEDLVRMYPYNAVNSYDKLQSALTNDNREYIYETYEYDIYKPTNGSLSFVIADQEESFFHKQQEICNFLHNQKMFMIFSDDPYTTYEVRTTVDSFSSGDTFSSFSMSYTVLDEEYDE